MFGGFNGAFLLFSLSDSIRSQIIEQVKTEVISTFGEERMKTKELREKLSEQDKQQVFNFLISRSEELALDALMR